MCRHADSNGKVVTWCDPTPPVCASIDQYGEVVQLRSLHLVRWQQVEKLLCGINLSVQSVLCGVTNINCICGLPLGRLRFGFVLHRYLVILQYEFRCYSYTTRIRTVRKEWWFAWRWLDSLQLQYKLLLCTVSRLPSKWSAKSLVGD